MQKRVFIIHGWDGYPEEGWFPWLKKELEVKGFAVFAPQLPMPDEPRINSWVSELKKVVGEPDEQTYFVGHSIGCQAIIRYIETLPEGVMIGGVISVAGFFKRLTNLEDDDVVRSVVNEWLKTPIKLKAAKLHFLKSIAIFSDDDPYVPMDNKEDFVNVFESKIVIEHKKGHFSGSTGIKKLPSVLAAVLEIAGEKR